MRRPFSIPSLALAALFALGLGAAASEPADRISGGVDVAGCWIGEVYEQGIGNYQLILEVGETEGKVRYQTDYGICVAELSRMVDLDEGAAQFRERLTVGVDLCVDQLKIRLTPAADDKLHFEELESGIPVVLGPLARNRRDAEGRCLPPPALTS